jgi:hypothetical protein
MTREIADGVPLENPGALEIGFTQRLRCPRRDENAAGFCEGKAIVLQISARGKIHRRIAEDRNRQDRPSDAVEDLGTLQPRKRRPRESGDPYAAASRFKNSCPTTFAQHEQLWLWVPAQGRDDAVPLSPQPRPAIEPGEIAVIILGTLRAHDGVADAGVFACGVIDVLADGAR